MGTEDVQASKEDVLVAVDYVVMEPSLSNIKMLLLIDGRGRAILLST